MAATTPFRVMTVFTGNICRSPMAEVVLRDRLRAAGLGPDVVVVDSTGVTDYEAGNPMDPRAARVLQTAGYDDDALAGHVARHALREDVAAADLVLAMTSEHAQALRHLLGDPQAPAVRMYRSFDPAAPAVAAAGPSGAPAGVDEHLLDVEDPWFGTYESFVTCLAEVEAAADGVVEHVRAALASRSTAR